LQRANHVCQPESAELAKYVANAFLAVKITFINEVADLCETVGAAVGEVATALERTAVWIEISPCRSRLRRFLLSQGCDGPDPHRARRLGLRYRSWSRWIRSVLVDLRNVYSEALATEARLTYYAVGRPPPTAAGHGKKRAAILWKVSGNLSRQ
jgi:hypothetical protein